MLHGIVGASGVMSSGSAGLARASLALPDVVVIPAGRFAMGSADGRPDERPVHDVAVGPFALARTPVSNAQYAAFLDATGSSAPPW